MANKASTEEEFPDYKIITYTGIDALFEFIASFSGSNPTRLKMKHHYAYFKEYFEHEKLQTIVVETSYIDKDYLDDFAHYYVRSFSPYGKLCARLHFFNEVISDDYFAKLLDIGIGKDKNTGSKSDGLLQKSYVGSMIIKPIPNTCIGKTTLKHYDTNDDGRVYPITRSYIANLFGIELKVKSLAFQEQDSSVAACATSALWSTFQGTGMLFHHSIPSPVHITESATKNYPALGRNFPSTGLNSKMMAQAIREVNLEPYHTNATDYHPMKANIYAFLNAKIPAILGAALFETDNTDPPTDGTQNDVTFKGFHAVAVTGYDLGLGNSNYFTGKKSFPLFLKSSQISQIFVHDDQLGPFARMEFNDPSAGYMIPNLVDDENDDSYREPQLDIAKKKEAQRIEKSTKQTLKTTWNSQSGSHRKTIAWPNILLVPIHNKIRVPFEDILILVKHLNATMFYKILTDENAAIVWDIKLNWLKDVKIELLNEQANGMNIKGLKDILTKPYPKYIWRCVLEVSKRPVMEIWFDATDISNGDNHYLCTIPRFQTWIKEAFVEQLIPRINPILLHDLRSREILLKIMDDAKKLVE